MILGEVHEDAQVELAVLHPPELQGVGGHLHDHVGDARAADLGEQSLQLEGLGGGVRGGEHLCAPAVVDGPDDAWLVARLSQD